MEELKKCEARHSIGVFDSGVGGLTVVKEMMRQLPCESIIYCGDTARVPYGSKSPETIVRMARENIRFLKCHAVKMIVVACHSASAVGLDLLASECGVPMIGVVTPGAKKAMSLTKNNRIGVIGTSATIQSHRYEEAIRAYAKTPVEVFSRATPLLVPLVEEGWVSGAITESIIAHYLDDMDANNIDTLILGCTHYPMLKETIRRMIAPHVALVDSAEETVAWIKATLQRCGLLQVAHTRPEIYFYVSDAPEKFKDLGSFFLERPIDCVRYVDLQEGTYENESPQVTKEEKQQCLKSIFAGP